MLTTNREKRTDRIQKFLRFFLTFFIFSFLGWAWETVYVSALGGHWVDRGFLNLPICPIYGFCIMALYALLGTPDEPHTFGKKIQGRGQRYVAYWFFAGLIPTVAELISGFFFDYCFDMRLWTYESYPLNFRGYICLPISLFWAFAVTLIMKYVFPPVQKKVNALSCKAVTCWGWALLLATAMDTVICYAAVLSA